ncbi:hypothetical protein [Nocardioides solisilvae]|uniref:hypothetical protein n=1 Tax=Nocardioides solisilvae TaxID=1542435 RepID=UPI000D74AAC4|nr:hypothetical protein [Nocardioides solisilvae]
MLQLLLDALRSIEPAQLRPRAVLHLHLTVAGMADPRSAVGRVEECGPVLASQVAHWLGPCQVAVEPVVDLAEAVAATGYEHAERGKERVWLLTGGRDMFPWACGRSRRVDFDHPTPWEHRPPGQTGTHHSQPLSRWNHRPKTHAGFEVRQVGPGRYLWRTALGHYLTVGPEGTRPVSPQVGAVWFAAEESGLEVVQVRLAG